MAAADGGRQDGGAELRFSHTLAALHFAGIVGLMLVLLASVLWISREHNQLARDSSVQMMRGGLASYRTALETMVRDYSIWDEAYAAIIAGDREWLHSNLGSAASEIGTLDVVAIADPRSGEGFGWVRGSPPEGVDDLLPQDLLQRLLGLAETADPGTFPMGYTFARWNGEVWAFAITAVRPLEGAPEGVSISDLPRQLHGWRVPKVLRSIGEAILIDDLRLMSEPLPGHADVPVVNSRGQIIAHVAWEPARPGASILRKVAFPLGLAMLVLATIASAVSRYAVRSAQRLEEALIAARAADRSKTEFLSNVTHELRTPMNGVIGVAQLLKLTDLDDEQKELVEVLTTSADIQMSLISDLLDLTKIESGNRHLVGERFEPEAVLRELVDLIRPTATQKGLELESDLGALAGIAVKGDGKAFRQIVTNLLGNAVKFTQSGRVLLAARMELVEDCADLAILVGDTGQGIAPEDQERIFERFVQVDGSSARRAQGTGLGLAISRSLAELMDGFIEVESTLGAGSTFTFRVRLPLMEWRQEVGSAA